MEAVRAFNNELSSLYEGRPPISRAKMAQVTKNAIKAIKFYKHVVQSVEKFIQKCKPEYKVPGLYVIDSIVRQSRHQFGPEKDVFSPRFTKNIVHTFTNLLKCPPEERSRVVRVLNLWQKNSVFPVDVIQPLLDLAADPNNSQLVTAAQRSVDAVVSVTQKVPLPGTHSSSSNNVNGTSDSSSNQLLQQKDMLTTITKLLQQAQDGSISATAPESQLEQLQQLQQQLVMQTERISKPQQSAPPIDSNLLAQIQTLTNQLLSKTGASDERAGLGGGDAQGGRPIKVAEPGFNKKLLDFDYGESDDEDDHQDAQQQHHHHHQQQQHQHMQQHQHNQTGAMNQQMPPQPPNLSQPPPMLHPGIQGLLQNPNLMPPMPPMPPRPPNNFQEQQEQQMRQRFLEQQQQEFDREIGQSAMVNQMPPQEMMMQNHGQEEVEDERDSRERDRRRHRSKDRSRSPRRRRRSRSRSRDRRRRSRSRDRYRRSRSRERENSRREREKERERKKAGMPPLKDNCISVCTTTLWFGHLTKHTTEDELREHIERYGTIKTINMIPPRGCAFVCLTKRKEAFKALDRLKGVKVNGNSLKVAWAPGIGVKESMFKELWDVEQGVTYIPWEQLPMDIAGLLGGGMVDEDSLPARLKGIKTGEEDDGDEQAPPSGVNNNTMSEDMSLPPPHLQPQQQQQQPQQQQPPPPPQQMMMGMQGQSNFPGPMQGNMQGQNPLGMMGPRGQLGMLGAGPPRMGMRPTGPLGGQNMNLNMAMNPSNIGGLGNRPLGPAGLGLRPGLDLQNLRPQSPMSGGMMDANSNNSMMGGPPRMDSGGPRGGLGPLGMNNMNNMNNRFPLSQFPLMATGGGNRLPFFNNMNNMANSNCNNDDSQGQMGDSDMRSANETKEWPPDDEVNAEDEEQDSDPMDSDDRMMPMMQPGLQPPLGGGGSGPFRPRGPMMQGMRGPPNPMLANLSRAVNPSTAISSMLPLRMMQSSQRQPVLTMPGGGPSAAAFQLAQNLARAGIRIPLPGLNLPRPGMVPSSAPQQRMLPPSPGAGLAVSVGLSNASRVVPGIPSINMAANRPSPQRSPSPSERRAPSDTSDSPQPSDGPIPLMQVQGTNNQPSGGTILGRGFSPMTIRPRGGAGLLGMRPGSQAGPGGFGRFGGPRPLMGPAFGNFERPAFAGRMATTLRPRLPGFFDEDKDERRLHKLDVDERSGPGDVDERGAPKDVDERQASPVNKTIDNNQQPRQDINTTSTVKGNILPSGRKSRWSDAVDTDSPKPDNSSNAPMEPINTVMEPMNSGMEPINTDMEPINTTMEPINTNMEPINTDMSSSEREGNDNTESEVIPAGQEEVPPVENMGAQENINDNQNESHQHVIPLSEPSRVDSPELEGEGGDVETTEIEESKENEEEES